MGQDVLYFFDGKPFVSFLPVRKGKERPAFQPANAEGVRSAEAMPEI